MNETSLPEERGSARPEFLAGELRVQTIRAFEFFSIGMQTTMEQLVQIAGDLIGRLSAARDAAGVTTAGPVVLYYRGAGPQEPFWMEAGFPVAAGTQAYGEAQVRRVESYRCAGLVYCGDLPHTVSHGYEALMQAMQRAGLQATGECWEWYLHFEDDDSPNNVTWLQLSV